MDKILAWHFVAPDRRLGYGSNAKVEVGRTYTCKWPYVYNGTRYDRPGLCEAGMHGSRHIFHALGHAPGPIVCRVEIWGDVVEYLGKMAGRYRHVLAMADATVVLHEFACRCAEHELRRMGIQDQRLWDAIETKRRWMQGDCMREELENAETDAWNAVPDYVLADETSRAKRAAARAACHDAIDAAHLAANNGILTIGNRNARNRLLRNMINKLLEEQ